MKSSCTRLKILNCILVYTLLLTASCETFHGKVYPDRSLVERTLKPRAGHKGKLTWRRCLEYKWGKCKQEQIDIYDLSQSETRKRLNLLNFRCFIGKKRYKICIDKPGLCHFFDCKDPWFSERKCKVQYLDARKEYQHLLDAKLRCNVSEFKYDLS